MGDTTAGRHLGKEIADPEGHWAKATQCGNQLHMLWKHVCFGPIKHFGFSPHSSETYINGNRSGHTDTQPPPEGEPREGRNFHLSVKLCRILMPRRVSRT